MTVLDRVTALLPEIQFVNSTTFCWSPKHRRISYVAETLETERGQWSLLHEAGHALLGHKTYQTDFELLVMEVNAWERARKLGITLGIHIDSDHIEDCLDTYRDWLHRRSLCPTCGTVSLQHDATTYACHNCPARWHVSSARFCRPYRKMTNTNKQLELASQKNTISFQ